MFFGAILAYGISQKIVYPKHITVRAERVEA
jgi:hypothetical protein